MEEQNWKWGKDTLRPPARARIQSSGTDVTSAHLESLLLTDWKENVPQHVHQSSYVLFWPNGPMGASDLIKWSNLNFSLGQNETDADWKENLPAHAPIQRTEDLQNNQNLLFEGLQLG